MSQPFGRKPGMLRGREILIDFDRIYFDVIKPAVESMGYTCFRGDDGPKSGVVHKRLLQAVMESEAMIADLSGKNPNVIYDLGIRHALQRGSTVIIGSEAAFPLPFVLNNLFIQRYDVGDTGGLDGEQVTRLHTLINESLSEETTASPIHEYFPDLKVELPKGPCVFIGHGRNSLWLRLQRYLEGELKIPTVSYESESRVGQNIIEVLDSMMAQTTFAILVLTGEDETVGGQLRARQNVVHEVGLFQGRLGFRKVVLLLQKGLEEFSNVAGLQYIEFDGDHMDASFYQLRAVLVREKLLAE